MEGVPDDDIDAVGEKMSANSGLRKWDVERRKE